MVKFENWNTGKKTKQRRIVARDAKGRFVSHTKVKGAKLTKSKAEEVIKEFKTFKREGNKRIKKDMHVFEKTKVKEESLVTPSSFENRHKKPNKTPRKPKKGLRQYVVEGVYNGKMIYGRSGALGSPLSENPRRAKDKAWENFLAVLGKEFSSQDKSDPDEGIKHIDKVSNIKEGWVVYR